MERWREFRLWYGPTASMDGIFQFKKEALLPLLDRLKFGYTFILDQGHFFLVRIELDGVSEENLKSELEQLIAFDHRFMKVTVESWSPENDARNRIESALDALRKSGEVPSGFQGPGWGIAGRNAAGAWAIQEENLEEKTEEFAGFMARVAGSFTTAYLRAMPRRVSDRWLKSLFVHLLLDSISTPQDEEKEIRDFPYV